MTKRCRRQVSFSHGVLSRSIACIGVLVVLAGCGALPRGATSGQSPAVQVHVKPGPAILSAGLAHDTTGWVLTGKKLEANINGVWRNATPPNAQPVNIRAAFFLNANRAWAIAMQPPSAVGNATAVVFISADGGRHWVSSSMQVVVPERGVGSFYLSFVDPLHGWLVVDEGSHAGFSYASLYRTGDGGRSWMRLAVPQSAPVTFATASDGVSSGGPASIGTYLTHDGGQSWQRLLVSAPSPYSGVVFGSPTFVSGTDGVIPANIFDAGGLPAAVGFFTTTDSGRSWKVAATLPNPASNLALIAAINLDHWVIPEAIPANTQGVASRETLRITTNRGGSWSDAATLPGSVDALYFANPTIGLAVLTESGCSSFKSDCYENTGLFQTDNGGQSWAQAAI